MGRRLVFHSKKCIACHACELVCSAHRVGAFNPRLSRIRIREGNPVTAAVCRQCRHPKCVETCTYDSILPGCGNPQISPDTCQACYACVAACPFEAIHVDPISKIPRICDLCGGSTRCAEVCPSGALVARGVIDKEIASSDQD